MNPAPDYPINLRLEGQRVLVVGGGEVAEGRVCGLVVACAEVTLVSPEITEGLKVLVRNHGVTWVQREVEEADVEGQRLVFTAADDPAVGQRVAAWCRARGILVNVADDPPNLDFAVPAMFRRGDILVAISTTGQSPGFAAALKMRLQEHIDETDARALDLIAEARSRLRTSLPEMMDRFAAVKEIVALDVPRILRESGEAAARERICEIAARWEQR